MFAIKRENPGLFIQKEQDRQAKCLRLVFSILIYLNYDRFIESEITSISTHAYQTLHNAKSISPASVSFPVCAFNRELLTDDPRDYADVTPLLP